MEGEPVLLKLEQAVLLRAARWLTDVLHEPRTSELPGQADRLGTTIAALDAALTVLTDRRAENPRADRPLISPAPISAEFTLWAQRSLADEDTHLVRPDDIQVVAACRKVFIPQVAQSGHVLSEMPREERQACAPCRGSPSW